jgi:hypothetical protein
MPEVLAVRLHHLSLSCHVVCPAQVVFKSAAAINGSIYQRLALLSPAALLGPINLLAHMFPDKAFQQVLEARFMLSSASMALVRQARSADEEKRAREAAAGADAVAVVTGADVAAVKGGASRARGSIAPGSFLGLLLSARDKAGYGLTDLQMLMQANTFTLAGVSGVQGRVGAGGFFGWGGGGGGGGWAGCTTSKLLQPQQPC